MPSWEFTYWQAEYRRQPWGEQLQDVHFAQLAATVCNATGNFKTPKRAEDFLLLKQSTAPASGLSEEARKYLKESKRGKRR